MAIKFYDTFVCLDTETTGLSPNYGSRITEICAVKVVDGVVADKISTLLDSVDYVPPEITRLTGITAAMLIGKPRPADIAPTVAEFIGDNMLLGANPKFDITFLRADLNIVVHDSKLIDVCKIARALKTDTPNHKLQTLARYFGIHNTAHRAEGDVMTTIAVYDCLRKLHDGERIYIKNMD
ncbi:MAG: hypothetical protein LBN42_01665 [Oscillospiraceae bacterium]|jgi:DNA polymerase III epsilon subunit family exonuclease|nr:hypothetical protein [Oscillospiraceae bacterium]